MTTFDVDGAVGWIRDAGMAAPAPWAFGFGPWDTATPVTINRTGTQCGEDYTSPDPAGGANGYHAPYTGSWHGPVLTGDTGTSMSAYDIPWTGRPAWSPCSGLDNTQYGGATIETWWRFVIPTTIPAGVTHLRLKLGVQGRWFKVGAYMGIIGGTWVPNPVTMGKTVQLRIANELPNSFEYGTLLDSHVLTTYGVEYMYATIPVTQADKGRVYYIALTQLPSEHYIKGSVHCSLAFDVLEYPGTGGGGSWSINNGPWTWEWVIVGKPPIVVNGGSIDSLPVIDVGDTPSVEVREACALMYGGEIPVDVDEDHVVTTTPITTISSIDDSTSISLLEPTALPATAFTWKFRLTHTFTDRAQSAQGVKYSCREYSYDTVSGVSFLTYAQSVAAAYEKTVTLQESCTAIGGVGLLRWEVTTKGYGMAVLTVGDWESEPFRVYSDRWYGMTVVYPDSGAERAVSFVLSDYADGAPLASISYPTTGDAERVLVGGRGVVFEPNIAVGFDEITLEGTFADASIESYYVPPEPDLGWNLEYVKVENGQFTLEAQPAAGSVKVESFRTGLLDYPTDWEEADDTGTVYYCRTDDDILSVTYLVALEFLENRISSARPEEQESQQFRRINYI